MIGISLMGCSSSREVTGETTFKERDLKGTWEVINIRFVGKDGLYTADLLDVADSRCFKGSEWVFIPNNNTGRFTLPAGSLCPEQSHRIRWSFFKNDAGSSDFQFKYVDERNRDLSKSKSGYRLKIAQLNVPNMELRINTQDENRNPFEVVLTFARISDDINL